MSGDHKLEGQCLCGTVRVAMTPAEPHVDACHCDMCRCWGGGAFLSLGMVSDPAISGAEHVVRYPSSDWAERGFCGRCGTHLYYYFKPKAGYSFAAGLFPGAADFSMTMEIFTDEKPGYYDFAGERERLTGPEVMVKFGISET